MKGLNCGRQKWLLSYIPTLIAADSVPKHFLNSHCEADVWNKEIEQSHCVVQLQWGRGWCPDQWKVFYIEVLLSLMSLVFSSSKLLRRLHLGRGFTTCCHPLSSIASLEISCHICLIIWQRCQEPRETSSAILPPPLPPSGPLLCAFQQLRELGQGLLGQQTPRGSQGISFCFPSR